MIVEKIPVEKFVIKEIPGLDPLHVYLEDHAPGKGTLTLRCYDKSWTSGWGAMGKETLREFILSSDNSYLANCLVRGIRSTQFSGDALEAYALGSVLARRRGRSYLVRNGRRSDLVNDEELDREEARELYNEVKAASLGDYDAIQHCPPTLMTELFGPEWWFVDSCAVEPNPDYDYLCRILDALRAGLRHQAQEPQPEKKAA